MTSISCIEPDWPAPAGVRALITTRVGGVSEAPYASLNLGDHVGDDPGAVAQNRARVTALLPGIPLWLRQVHGVAIADPARDQPGCTADGAVTRLRGRPLVVLTADCLPVLLADEDGTAVAIAHAGWRGLAAGVIEHAVHALRTDPKRLIAYLGPAIGPKAFEVGRDVADAFLDHPAQAASAFRPGAPGKWFADLYALARLRLAGLGVDRVYGGSFCTYSDAHRFYSHRRDPCTGRTASLVWLEP